VPLPRIPPIVVRRVTLHKLNVIFGEYGGTDG
jgi:hypothetical protein